VTPEKGPLQKAREASAEMRAMLVARRLIKDGAAPILGNNEQPREADTMPTDKTTLAARLRTYATEYEKVAKRAPGIMPMVTDMRAAADGLETVYEVLLSPEAVLPDPVESTGEQVLFPSEITKPKAEKA
jgi:hypothetical protein